MPNTTLNKYQKELKNLSPNLPIVLFPLRIETRISNNQLYIRAFPDQIAINYHKHSQSETEKADGQSYWKTKENQFERWRQLTAKYGVKRASWIVSMNHPSQPIADKINSTGGGRSIVMPTNLVFSLYSDKDPTKPFQKIGEKISENLKFGFTESVAIETQEAKKGQSRSAQEQMHPNQIPTDPMGSHMQDNGLNWLTNFQKAVEMGMAIHIPLNQLPKKIKQIVVVGVRLETPEKSQKNVQQLFRDHTFSHGGLGFVPPGTPTNNMSDSDAGYRTDLDVKTTYQYINGADSLLDLSDGKVLADALGIEGRSFKLAKEKNARTLENAMAMNTVLWPATLGYYLEEMYGIKDQIEHIFTPNEEDDLVEILDNTRRFFLDNVKGRGVLPSIRVDNQPYGLLVTSAYNYWKPKDESLFKILDLFKQTWTSIAKEAVQSIDQYPNDFLNILSLQSSSKRLFHRYGMTGKYSNDLNIVPNDFNRENLSNVKLHDSDLSKTKLFQLYYLNKHKRLTSPWVEKDTPKEQPLEINYISTIAKHTISELENKLKKPSQTILESLLIHAKLNQYWDGAMRILVKEEFEDLRFSDFTAKDWEESELDFMFYDILDRKKFINDLKSKNFHFSYREIIGESTNSLINNANPASAFVYYKLKDNEEFPSPPKQIKDQFHAKRFWMKKVVDRRNYKSFILGLKLPKDCENINQVIQLYDYFQEINDSQGDDISLNEELFSKYDSLPNHSYDPKEKNLYKLSLKLANGRAPFLDLIVDETNLKGIKDISQNKLFSHLFPIKIGNLISYFSQFNLYQKELKNVSEFNSSLKKLGTLSIGELEMLLSEHIDLCSYRLDAWILGLYHQRLQSLRSSQPKGIHIGAYGYLENLDLDPKEKKDTPADGYIHTLTMQHAVTAAILRSGYLRNMDDPKELAINLSSRRVRNAQYYLEGIRNGRSINELLGYRFERILRDNKKGSEIRNFRKDFGFNLGNKKSETLGYVTDGLAVIDAHKKEKTSLATFANDIDQIEDDLDAIGDVILSESVFQMSRGNYERAGAVLDIINNWNYPPEMEILQTPRSGNTVNHRVCLTFQPPPQSTKQNKNSITQAALVAPTFNLWLSKHIGDLSLWGVGIVKTDEAGEEEIKFLPLSSLTLYKKRIQPIDIYQLLAGNYQSRSKELYSLLLKSGRSLFKGKNQVASNYHINFEYAPNGKRPLIDLGYILDAVAESIGDSRPINEIDFNHSSHEQNQLEYHELNQFFSSIVGKGSAFEYLKNLKSSIIKGLKKLKRTGSSSSRIKDLILKTLKQTLLQNYEQTIEFYLVDEEKIDQLKKGFHTPVLDRLANELIEKINHKEVKINTLLSALSDGQDIEEKIATYKKIAKIVFGPRMLVSPTLKISGPEDPSYNLSNSLKASSQIVKGNLVNEDWLSGISRVREKMNPLEQFVILENIMREKEINLIPLQLPIQINSNNKVIDTWVGWELPKDYYKNHPEDLSKDKLSVLLLQSDQQTMSMESGQLISGFVIDEWTETIPDKELTTGIALNYNEPDSHPPQTILLAVHPTMDAKDFWTIDYLNDTILSTMELAKIRAVEPDHILKKIEKDKEDGNELTSILKQLLPAIMTRVVDIDIENDWSLDFGNFDDDEDTPLF